MNKHSKRRSQWKVRVNSGRWTMDVQGDGVQLISRVLVTFGSARRKCCLDIAAHHNTLLMDISSRPWRPSTHPSPSQNIRDKDFEDNRSRLNFRNVVQIL